jgi:hypothetical protein
MTWRLVVVAAALLIGLSGQSPAADTYLKEELRIPLPAAGSHGLEALLVRSNEPERYPLAVLSHGSPRSPNDRPNMTAWSMLPQAIEFARRGWAAVVVMRRGAMVVPAELGRKVTARVRTQITLKLAALPPPTSKRKFPSWEAAPTSIPHT